MADVTRNLLGYEPSTHEAFVEMLSGIGSAKYQQPNWLYETTPHTGGDGVFQGDILAGPLRLPYRRDGQRLFSLSAPVMVLSNGCDVVPGRNDMVTLAPIFTLAEFAAQPEMTDARLEGMRGNRSTSGFFLPACGPVEEDSWADFVYATSLPSGVVNDAFSAAEDDERLRLRSHAWYLFTAKLAHHFARAEDPTDTIRAGVA